MQEVKYEKDYTKLIVSDNYSDFDLVESEATKGWILCAIVLDPSTNLYNYWFQTKRKIYMDQMVAAQNKENKIRKFKPNKF